MQEDLFNTHLDRVGARSLLDAGKWTRTLSIIYYVLFGIFVFAFLVLMVSLQGDLKKLLGEEEVSAGMVAMVMIPVLLVVYLLAFFLHRFASFTRRAIYQRDEILLEKGIRALKNYFLLYGVIAIIGLVFGVIGLLTGISST